MARPRKTDENGNWRCKRVTDCENCESCTDSETLIGCRNVSTCRMCSGCVDSEWLVDCARCTESEYCVRSVYLKDCAGLSGADGETGKRVEFDPDVFKEDTYWPYDEDAANVYWKDYE